MADGKLREVEHSITVAAPPAEVYRLIAEVENWPQLFPPTVYAESEELSDGEERIRIWATANGEAKHWTSRRTLDPVGLRIEFGQEVSSDPVATMGGTWIIEPLGETESLIRLLHHYRAVDDDPEKLSWIDRAVDTNSRSELDALKRNAELLVSAGQAVDEIGERFSPVLSFEDSVRIDSSAKDVYDFLNEAQLWTDRLPHVARVRLTESVPGLQVLNMDTLTKSGESHTTESIRVCMPHLRIAYKQTTLPPLMLLHTGQWRLSEDDEGVTTAVSQHTVVINVERITEFLGPEADLGRARIFIRDALGNNSRATLALARQFTEARH
ncbi:aromatase/cyclase [Streptomyces europaeiscabiei]|uniref:aromatase/cyclase n=1 Tax=Streptomyces europaeiscabiei TaxID=146819 RepID=UPI002E18A9B5